MHCAMPFYTGDLSIHRLCYLLGVLKPFPADTKEQLGLGRNTLYTGFWLYEESVPQLLCYSRVTCVCVCVCNLIGRYPLYTANGRRKKYKLRDLVYGSVVSVYGCHNMWEFMIMDYDTQSRSTWHWNTLWRKTLQWAESETGYLVIHFVWKRSDPWEEYTWTHEQWQIAWLISQ